MATTVTLNANVNLTGSMVGSTGRPGLNNPLSAALSLAFTQGGTGATLIDQILDGATGETTLTAGSTTDIDLTTGEENPLVESISGADAFAKVRLIYVSHESTSLASSIVVFDAASNAFQGPVEATAGITLKPGEGHLFWSATTAGWTVDGTHKVFRLVNADGVNDATVRYLVGGSKT